MTQSLQIVFHGINRSTALEKDVTEKFEALRRFDPRLGEGKVTVTQESHQPQGDFSVLIAVKSCSGKDIIVKRNHTDALAAVHDAFDTLRRAVKEEHDKAHRL